MPRPARNGSNLSAAWSTSTSASKVIAASGAGYTIYRDDEPFDGKYEYTKSWTQQDLLCPAILQAYQEVSLEVMHKLDAQLQPTVTELFKATLDQLYEK